MSSYNRKYRDLEVWKQSIALATNMYAATEAFPKHEIYGLSSQMRRASVSVASNIAEGSRRKSPKEFAQFLHIALGSCAELITQLQIAINTKFLENEIFLKLDADVQQIERMLVGLLRSVKTSKPKNSEIFSQAMDQLSDFTTHNS